VAAGYGDYYRTTGRFLVSTDDAYVQAHSVLISPKVSGYISEVPVDDNQAVHAGQTLARIDDRDYLAALAAARAAIDNLDRRIAQQRLAIVEAQAAVTTDQAALRFSQQQYGAIPASRALRVERLSSAAPKSASSPLT
jgi:membrane fusion protein (multidrug efflux system)